MNKNASANFETEFMTFHRKISDSGAQKWVISKFERLYHRLLMGDSGIISRQEIDPVLETPDADMLTGFENTGLEALPGTIIVKLNGGLGTSMGLDKAKSLLPVKNNLSFLDIIVRQLTVIRKRTGVALPLVFMNSQSTREDTLGYLKSYPKIFSKLPLDFVQCVIPKVRQTDLQPAEYPAQPMLEWCPPGHGDIYDSMFQTGILDLFLDEGYEYAFVSNADNLGAVIDLNILGYFAGEKFPFMMEVADRTSVDRKGGHLARSKDGRLTLREIAQCPEDEQEQFQNVSLYKYFNTNSIWLNLRAIKKRMVASGGFMDLPLICNSKTVNPTDPESEPVYHLETAMGAALSLFENACALRVPRTRFAPVKTCQDLVAVWSDAYILTPDYHVRLNPNRKNTVEAHLDPRYYRMIEDVKTRFPQGAPSLERCSEWTVKGDVVFGKNIVLRGKVTIIGADNRQSIVPDGTIIEDCEYRI